MDVVCGVWDTRRDRDRNRLSNCVGGFCLVLSRGCGPFGLCWPWKDKNGRPRLVQYSFFLNFRIASITVIHIMRITLVSVSDSKFPASQPLNSLEKKFRNPPASSGDYTDPWGWLVRDSIQPGLYRYDSSYALNLPCVIRSRYDGHSQKPTARQKSKRTHT